ncbi:hypothetical protein [Variovorax sp. PAMC26660]|uniref:hypothetical protein n=1 Tax=Variovorax sp. PAMC26660 TaxID=2762322 RepID=UPI00164CE142|nr:hypothetical protein [Variovorax sp. PAMC26660]QNK66084.1 hypothetical protein H7F35_23170 [Variovorax sp. PAMC26660]
MHIHAFTRSTETPVNLFGIDVLFKLNAVGHAVAEVTDARAAERLLSIKEAYREYHPSTADAVVAAAAPVATPAPAPAPVAPISVEPDPEPEVPKGHSSDAFPLTFEIAEGKTVTIAEILAAAQARSGLDVEEWNLNDVEDRDTLIEAEIDLQVQAAAPAATPEGAATPVPAISLVLKAEDGTTVDVGAMSAKDVRAFAAQNGVELPSGNSTKVADLRLMVVQALTKA